MVKPGGFWGAQSPWGLQTQEAAEGQALWRLHHSCAEVKCFPGKADWHHTLEKVKL